MRAGESVMMNREVRREVRVRVAEYLGALEGEALIEWVGPEWAETAYDEVQRIIRKIRP